MSNPSDFFSNKRSGFGMMPDMEEEQFLLWQNLLEERTGMCLAPQRKSFLQTSLGIRMRELGCDDYEDYYKKVTTGSGGGIEWSILSDRLTVQETRFFRDPDAMAFVKNHLLAMVKTAPQDRSFDILSMGCSSGEEVYSLAMLADECLSHLGFKYSVTGTDLSTVVLRKARQGKYPIRKLETLPASYRQRYCIAVENNEYQIISGLRDRTCFSQVNALNLDAFPVSGLSIIYCQNLLIYFRRWRRREILNALADRLVEGGILVTGLGEMVDWQHPNLVQVDSNKLSIYVRRDNNNQMGGR
ncbi:Methylase of chemotaxis methyl-accepting protein, CheR-type [Oleispira antarctica RB-8]|uniref:protein-glutamate O-methyltransferase n=1 Tax=Oleispira antarctica RB-8 TaxID=698738 RepID=R4YQ49_OLEAN|nr:Methylase of chemotaxis methyl-accepting protein, CheR-type [Oleispira antarctica RB-8]